MEATLAALGNTLDAGYQAYNDIKFKDIHFPDVETDGQVIPMTYNSLRRPYAIRTKYSDPS